MTFPFQVSEVVRPLRVDAVRAVALSYKLQQRTPESASPAVHKCAESLRVSTEALVEARCARGATSTVDNRVVVLTLVNAWGALHGRIESLTKLDPDDAPEASGAEGVLSAVFSQGKGFLKADHDMIWIESDALLTKIDKDGHAPALDRLAGGFVLKAIRKAHRACGVALGFHGVGTAGETEGVALKPLLDAVTGAIAAYALQVVAGANADDAASVREAAYALDPIVQQRKRAKGRAVEGEGGDEPVDGPIEEDAKPVVNRAITVDASAANDTAATKGRRVA